MVLDYFRSVPSRLQQKGLQGLASDQAEIDAEAQRRQEEEERAKQLEQLRKQFDEAHAPTTQDTQQVSFRDDLLAQAKSRYEELTGHIGQAAQGAAGAAGDVGNAIGQYGQQAGDALGQMGQARDEAMQTPTRAVPDALGTAARGVADAAGSAIDQGPVGDYGRWREETQRQEPNGLEDIAALAPSQTDVLADRAAEAAAGAGANRRQQQNLQEKGLLGGTAANVASAVTGQGLSPEEEAQRAHVERTGGYGAQAGRTLGSAVAGALGAEKPGEDVAQGNYQPTKQIKELDAQGNWTGKMVEAPETEGGLKKAVRDIGEQVATLRGEGTRNENLAERAQAGVGAAMTAAFGIPTEMAKGAVGRTTGDPVSAEIAGAGASILGPGGVGFGSVGRTAGPMLEGAKAAGILDAPLTAAVKAAIKERGLADTASALGIEIGALVGPFLGVKSYQDAKAQGKSDDQAVAEAIEAGSQPIQLGELGGLGAGAASAGVAGARAIPKLPELPRGLLERGGNITPDMSVGEGLRGAAGTALRQGTAAVRSAVGGVAEDFRAAQQARLDAAREAADPRGRPATALGVTTEPSPPTPGRGQAATPSTPTSTTAPDVAALQEEVRGLRQQQGKAAGALGKALGKGFRGDPNRVPEGLTPETQGIWDVYVQAAQRTKEINDTLARVRQGAAPVDPLAALAEPTGQAPPNVPRQGRGSYQVPAETDIAGARSGSGREYPATARSLMGEPESPTRPHQDETLRRDAELRAEGGLGDGDRLTGGESATFYSALQRAVAQLPEGKLSPAQLSKQLLAMADVKREQMVWSGLDDYLTGKLQANNGKGEAVTKPELQQWLTDHDVRVYEIQKGAAGDPVEAQRLKTAWDEAEASHTPLLHRMQELERTAEDTAYKILGQAEERLRQTPEGQQLLDPTGMGYGRDLYTEASQFAWGYPNLPKDRPFFQALAEEQFGRGPTDLDSPPLTPEQIEQGLRYANPLYAALTPDERVQLEALRTEVHAINDEYGQSSERVEDAKQRAENAKYASLPGGQAKWLDYSEGGLYLPGAAEPHAQAREFLLTLGPRTDMPDYNGPHWDEQNVVAHIRMTTRTTVDGKRVLFIEELQSDWHQKARQKRKDNQNRPLLDEQGKPIRVGYYKGRRLPEEIRASPEYTQIPQLREAMTARRAEYEAFTNSRRLDDARDAFHAAEQEALGRAQQKLLDIGIPEEVLPEVAQGGWFGRKVDDRGERHPDPIVMVKYTFPPGTPVEQASMHGMLARNAVDPLAVEVVKWVPGYWRAGDPATAGVRRLAEEARELNINRVDDPNAPTVFYGTRGGERVLLDIAQQDPEVRPLKEALTAEEAEFERVTNEWHAAENAERLHLNRYPDLKDVQRADEIERKRAQLEAAEADPDIVAWHVRDQAIQDLNATVSRVRRENGHTEDRGVIENHPDVIAARDRVAEALADVRAPAHLDADNPTPEYRDWEARMAGIDAKRRQVEYLRSNLEGLESEARWNQGHFPQTDQPPLGPFQGEGWQRLALKRMLHLAAQEGYDYLGIITGDIQAQRYDPFRGQGIEALEYSRHTQTLTIERTGERVAEEKVPPEKLSEYVGEGVANALLRQPKGDPIEAARRAEPGAFGTNRVTAEDWEGGLVAENAMGVGMRKAYDEILPALLTETARRFGAEVKIAPETDPARALAKGQTEPAVLLDPSKPPEAIVEEGSEEQVIRERPNLQPAHLLEITPRMLEAQAQPGGMLPLFIRPQDGAEGVVPGAGMSRGARMADDLGTATGGVLGAARGYQEGEEEDARRRAAGEAGLSGIDRAAQTVFGGVKGAAIGKVGVRGARVARLLTEPGEARGNALADLRDALPKPPGSPGSPGGELGVLAMRPTVQFDNKLRDDFVVVSEKIDAKIAKKRAEADAARGRGNEKAAVEAERIAGNYEADLAKLEAKLADLQRDIRGAQTFPAGPTKEELAGGFTAFGQRSKTLPTDVNPFGADPGTPEYDAGRIFNETPPGQPVRPVLADGTPAMGAPGDLDRGNIVLVPRPDPNDPTGKKEVKTRVNSRDGDLTSVDEINRYIDLGAHGQHWYSEIAAMIREAATDLNGTLHPDVLAELAPLFGRTGHKTTPEHNYEAMLRLFLARNLIETQGRGRVPATLDEMQSAMRAVDPGKGGSPLFTDIYNSVIDMWRGGRAFIAGNLKLSQYSGVIADQAEGGISHWIVPDAWIFRALGYKNPSEAASDPVASRFSQAYIAKIAEDRGILPAEAQAMLWTGYRLENPEAQAVKIMSDIFAKRGLPFNEADLGLPPNIRLFNADLLQRFRQALTDGQFSVTLPDGKAIDVPMQPHQNAKDLEVAFVLPENQKKGVLPYAATNVTRRASRQFVEGVRTHLPDGQRLASQHQQSGQTSLDGSGQPIPAGTSVVRLFPERNRRVPGQAFDPVSWAGFRAQNADLLRDPRLGVVTWYNPDDGHTHFDVVAAATPAQVQALAASPPNRSIQERLDVLSGVANGGASTPTPGGSAGTPGVPVGGRSGGVAPGAIRGPGAGRGDRGSAVPSPGASGIIAGAGLDGGVGPGGGRGAGDPGRTGAASAPGSPASPDLGSAAGAGAATGGFDPEAVKRANRTSRTAGKFGEDALVPKLIPQLFTPEEAGAVLDFGSGKPPTHAVTLRGQGYDVTAHDFGTNVDPELHDPDALTRQYDTVYASRVLNVQENAGMMDQTLAQIAKATKPDGTVILNYPGDPRRWDDPTGPKLNGVGKTSPATVLAHLRKHFGTVEQINKDNARPIWRASDPIAARSPDSLGLVPPEQADTVRGASLGDAARTVGERFGMPTTRGDAAASGVGAALGAVSEAMEPGDEDEDAQERMWRILSGAGTGAATGLAAKRGGARAARALPRVLGNLPDLGRTDGLGSRGGAESGIIASPSGPSALPQLPPNPPPGGAPKTPAPLKPYGKGDLINDFQRFNMLWNPYTVGKQVVGGLASGPLQVGSRYVAWAVNQIPAQGSRITGKDSFLGMPKEDVFLGEGGAQMIGALSSIGDAFKDAISALQGKDPHSAQVLAQAGMGGQNAQAGQRPTSNAFMAGAQKAFRGSGNVYEAFTNAWLRTLAESGDYAGYAYRQAMQHTSGKGKQPGTSFRKEYSRLMQQRHNPTDADAKAIKARSAQGAKYRTLTQELEGLSAGVEDLRKYQGARFVLPFWQVPFNDVKFGLEHTPVGAVKTALDTARGKQTTVAEGTPDASGKLPQDRESTAAVSERLARSIVGTGMAVGVYNLAMADLITGGMPDDPTERELWQTEGRTPYSIRLGGQWIPLTQLSGYTAALTAGADAAAEMKRHARTGKPMDAGAAANLAARVVSRFVEAQANKPLLDGINDLTELTSAAARRDDITSGEGPAGRWLASTIGRFIPGSSLAASAVQASDPYFREANTVGERIKARLPGGSGSLEPQRDPLGRPIARGGFAEGGEGDNKLVRALPWASRDIRPRLGRYPNTKNIEEDMTAAAAARKVDAYYKDAATNPKPTREEFILAAQADEPQYRYAEGKRLAKSRKEATAAGKPVPAHIDPALRALVPQGGGGKGGGGLPKASPVARLLLAR